MRKMKQLFTALLLVQLALACKTEKPPLTPAGDGLEAGANFAKACLEGDFVTAQFYVVDNEAGKHRLDSLENFYRSLDKEGRNQLRTASINVLEFSNLGDSLSLFRFQNSYQKNPSKIYIQRMDGNWLIDFSKQ